MKSVTQSKVGAHGRCFPACVASILEVPEASVPGYEDTPDVYQWLAKRGLEYRQVPIDGNPAPVGYHIIEGISPRGGQHAVVGLDGKIVHDPHPQDGTGRGLVKPEHWGMLLPSKRALDSYNPLIGKGYTAPPYPQGTIERIQSVDGRRWAYSQWRKRRLGGGRYDVVDSWTLKERDASGKVVTVASDRWREDAVTFVNGGKAKDSMLSGLALQAAITPVYTRHNEIKATPRRSWQEVSRLLGETKALLDASRISDKAKWQTVLAHASSFLAMARDAERQGDNPHFVGWTERAFMMTHHVLDVLESLARRTTARDEANAPYGPGDLIKLPNGKITEVTKCLLGENLFHEPEYHVSTKTGECVVVPVKTRAKDASRHWLNNKRTGAWQWVDTTGHGVYGEVVEIGFKDPQIWASTFGPQKKKQRVSSIQEGKAWVEREKAQATDSLCKAPARLHRALDAVLDGRK